jgi:outer membrane protein OmpA-like peptidoglycan-associated protein
MRSKGNTNKELFWVSYADLMTALFIVTLSLFILSYKLFKDKEDIVIAKEEKLEILENQLNAKKEAIQILQNELDENELQALSLIEALESEGKRLAVLEKEYLKIREIQKAIEKLNPEYFVYQSEYKRHVLRKNVKFAAKKSDIPTSDRPYLINAGKELLRLIDDIDLEGFDIKYLLVIEGMASKDSYEFNDELSYARALAIKELWDQEGLNFDPNRVEIQIAGSGVNGVGRDTVDERNNQRILVQILPKIGELKDIEPAAQDSVGG